jgi:hypothetical protein
MAILTFNVSPQVLEDIKALVDKGLYASPEQFAEIGCLNQLAMERGVTPEALVEAGHRKPPGARSAAGSAVADRKSSAAKKSRKVRERSPSARPGSNGVPQGESEIIFDDLSTVIARLRGSAEVPGPVEATPRPVDERLLGLVNRLFGLKLVVREILKSASKGWPALAELADQAARDAAVVGDELERQDLKAGRRRAMLASGLPRTGNPQSIERFLLQYVGRRSRSGKMVEGAVVQYALAVVDGDRVGLTDQGARLAALANPVLDSAVAGEVTLGREEQAFLLDHVRKYVPGEQRDFSAILAAVEAGNDTPEALLAAVRPNFPQSWTDVMARGHLSGVMARLTETGAVTRVWSGRNVKYETSQQLAALVTSKGGMEARW